jgi:putative peptide zinc metalloprotease protein
LTIAPEDATAEAADGSAAKSPAAKSPTTQASAATATTASERPSMLGPNPRLAEGVQLIGEYEGSGYKEAPSMVRRADGQVIQLPDLLYRLAGKADGEHGYRQMADELGTEIQRRLDPEDVHFLVEEKLRPLGVLAAADGSSPSAEKVDPFLAFRFRVGVVSEKTSELLGELFKPLFFPPVLLAALVGLVAADYWLFFVHGVAQALRQSLQHPGIFLPLFLAVVLAAALHEIGHAAACRYGGGHPGKMGCGLYLAWPAFYTDVTDAYRLSRRARLRTDLGGVYLNVIIVLATVGAYFATHLEPLLLLVLIEHLEIVHQLLPVIRLDGYYIVADLTGVPDLFARIGPVLSSAIPGRKPDPRVAVLKPWVRRAITAWVFVVVPLLVFELVTVLIHLPRIMATAASSADKLWHDTGKAFSGGNVVGGISDVLQLIVLAIPILGIVLMLWRVAKSGATWTWTHTSGRPVLRGLSGAAGAVIVTLLALSWIPRHNYRSIQPHERGTVGEAVVALRYLPQKPSQLDTKATAKDTAKNTVPTTPLTTVPSAASTTTTLFPTRSSTTLGSITSTTRLTPTTLGQTPTTIGQLPATTVP